MPVVMSLSVRSSLALQTWISYNIGHNPNKTNSLESLLRHICIIVLLLLLSDHVQENIAEKILCIILKGIYGFPQGTFAETTL